ncbi:tetratricopeptide repeat protein [Azospirillum agricola]|uniref:tetratricopeptide repeat-containing glycosyltransferase family protein n=1 Tax=Azospirillum agricola TaxID=1720247 RepID=UPI000A0F372F|nr:tetratricopeptide repeat-containing glycosyltransferase family protein [Azospirillum agricola]SMH41291.1 Tfp pilus assembly protein PilF [Azospirillum lipoferum]
MSNDSTAQPVIDIPLIERMLAANPRDGGAWSTLGVLLRRAGKLSAAAACHARGVSFTPGHAGIWSNLGNALVDLGRYDEGIAAHRQSCELAAGTVTSWFNLAIALRKVGFFAEALEALDRGLALEPDNASLQWERSLAALQMGDYDQGFAFYEARRGIPAYRNRLPSGPAWDGGPLNGRRILLSTEQGFGDALLVARYVSLVKAMGGTVLFECHPELRTVLSGLPVDEVVTAGADYPAYDVYASLMSLPRLLGTRYDTIPAPTPITIPTAAREKAARLLGPRDGALRVGIVWSGRVTFADNARRATTLDRFLPFLEVPNTRFYSLQKGPPEAQLAELGTSALIPALGPQFDDFADTAAVIEQLDLVIMTDSSVAHLAGSLGKPIWNLVQHVPYWIYGYEGDRTPWYPSMRLFRQGRDENWDAVFETVKRALMEQAVSKTHG